MNGVIYEYVLCKMSYIVTNNFWIIIYEFNMLF